MSLGIGNGDSSPATKNVGEDFVFITPPRSVIDRRERACCHMVSKVISFTNSLTFLTSSVPVSELLGRKSRKSHTPVYFGEVLVKWGRANSD